MSTQVLQALFEEHTVYQQSLRAGAELLSQIFSSVILTDTNRYLAANTKLSIEEWIENNFHEDDKDYFLKLVRDNPGVFTSSRLECRAINGGYAYIWK